MSPDVFAEQQIEQVAPTEVQTRSVVDRAGDLLGMLGIVRRRGVMAQPTQQELDAFMAAIRKQESSNNYKAVGPSTKYGSATGAYQFLNSTWQGYGGYQRAMDAPPAVQDARAAQLMSAYYNRYGSWELVAVAWHGGPGKADTAYKSGLDALGNLNDGLMKTTDYARKAVQVMQDHVEGARVQGPFRWQGG